MQRKNYLFALFTLSLFTIHCFTYSQGCLPGGITFTTQEEIDNFQTNYPGCTEIEGGVTIGVSYGTSNITNLDGLSVLTTIGNFLIIKKNDSLTSLSGLSNLETIGLGFF